MRIDFMTTTAGRRKRWFGTSVDTWEECSPSTGTDKWRAGEISTEHVQGHQRNWFRGRCLLFLSQDKPNLKLRYISDCDYYADIK